MFWKDVYPYECMDSWERYNETSLPANKEFYISATITDDYCKHVRRVWEYFETQDLVEYHYVCTQSDTLPLADVYGILYNEYIEIYMSDPA